MDLFSSLLFIVHLAIFSWGICTMRKIGFGWKEIWLFSLAGIGVLWKDIAVGSLIESWMTTIFMTVMLWIYSVRLGALEKHEPKTLGQMRALNARFFREGHECVKRIEKKSAKLEEIISNERRGT